MSAVDEDRQHLQVMEPPDDTYGDALSGPAPTHNTPAEQALLGAILATPEIAPAVIDDLDPDDFHRTEHETIWTAVAALVGEDRTTDAAHILEHLQRSGDLTRIGGGNYLHTLYARSPGTTSPEQAHDYTRIILDASRLRRLGQVAVRLTQQARSGRADTIDDTLAQALDDLDQAVARIGATRPSVSTGLVDLSWVTQGSAPEIPPPVWGRRTDGHALFYAGRANGVYGDPEAAKTWLAQYAVVEALTAGQAAAFVDVDHNGADHTCARLLLLGARPEHLADRTRFRYYDPEEADELTAAITDITNHAPAVVVLDSIGEMLPMLGVKSIDNDEITAAMRMLCRPPARAGSCVITVDHLPKSHEARATGFAIGGTAKKRVIDGSYLEAEARVKPAPGQTGKITLRVEKDRTGGLRKTLPGGKYVGTFILDSTQPHTTVATVSREDSAITEAGIFRPTHLMEEVSRFVEANDQCTGRAIRDAIQSSPKNVLAALNRLIEEGYITPIPGPRKSTYHHAVSMYREDEDEQV